MNSAHFKWFYAVQGAKPFSACKFRGEQDHGQTRATIRSVSMIDVCATGGFLLPSAFHQKNGSDPDDTSEQKVAAMERTPSAFSRQSLLMSGDSGRLLILRLSPRHGNCKRVVYTVDHD